MKLSTKPISSPGRTEKFPPPLMRFLRTNVGSRSRGRTRSSPMFVRNKRNSNATIETQEPNSPKVTCMGQVRVRRSSKQPSKARKRRAGATARRRCKWLQNALLCRHIAWNIKPKCCGPAWRKWVLFFQAGCRRKGEARQDSPKSEQNFGNKIEFSEPEDEEEEEEEEDAEKEVVAKVFVSNSCSPPKNAFLLTRCRSAPYRSSSLASRFWESSLGTEEAEEQRRRTEQENNREEEHAENTAKPTSESESISDQESSIAPETEKKLEFLKEFEGSIKESFLPSSNIEDLKAVDVSVGPLILTRCKSEPARRGEKLDPDSNFWKRRRLGLTDSHSQPVL